MSSSAAYRFLESVAIAYFSELPQRMYPRSPSRVGVFITCHWEQVVKCLGQRKYVFRWFVGVQRKGMAGGPMEYLNLAKWITRRTRTHLIHLEGATDLRDTEHDEGV